MRSANAGGLRRISPCLFMLLASCFQLAGPSNAQTTPVVDTGSPVMTIPVEVPFFHESATFALPILEPAAPFKTHAILPPQSELKGFVSINDKVATPSDIVEHLVETTVARDKSKELLDRKAKFHNKKWTRLLGRSKDMLEFMTSYQGFESSSEAADVILEEKLKLKSRAAVEFVKQKRLDAAHLQLTCAVMEVATGLGLSDEQKKLSAIESGLSEMIPLVGKQEADQTLESMIAWSKHLSVADTTFERDPWDVLAVRNKSREMLSCSLRDDDVVKSIEARLHKYNHKSNFSRAAAKIVNTTCSIVALSPTIASPAAQTAEFIFVACTGGPEEKKLLKEVYLDRCFESRFDRLNQEISMSVNNYNSALLTHNSVLFSCSQSLMEKLTSPDHVANLTGTSVPATQNQPHKIFGERI